MTFAAASAAKPVTRATAERVFAQFLERAAEVNQNPYYLAKVVRVVLFGSMLKPEVDQLSDVDVAFELAQKEVDPRRALVQSRQRAEELEDQGRRFRSILEREFCCGYVEAYDFLKRRSRVIAWPTTPRKSLSFWRFRTDSSSATRNKSQRAGATRPRTWLENDAVSRIARFLRTRLSEKKVGD